MLQTLVNGQISDQLAVSDRGLHYGEGLFETLLCIDGQPTLWSRHYQRLQLGCSTLSLPCPDEGVLLDEVAQLTQDVSRCVIKLMITGGAAGRGYLQPEQQQITRIIAAHPVRDLPKDWYTQGIKATVCETRLAVNPALAGLKHLNRLEQVLARNEWSDSGIAEGLVRDTQERVIEGTMSNLFVVHNQRLITPDLSGSGVAGVMRAYLLDWAAEHLIEVSVSTLTLEQVLQADEVFFCNSVLGILPVRELAERSYQKGEVTAKLLAHVNQGLLGILCV